MRRNLTSSGHLGIVDDIRRHALGGNAVADHFGQLLVVERRETCDDWRPHLAAVAVGAMAAGASAFKHLASGIVRLGVEIRCDPDERQPGEHTDSNAHELTASVLIRGASPLGLPNTLSRAPLRRRAPIAWLTRYARSRH